MLRKLWVCAVIGLICAAASAPAATVAYITQANGSTSTSNTAVRTVLNSVFGATGYDYISSFPKKLTLTQLQSYDFVYVEGGIATGNNFSNFLGGNQSTLESYVNLGGRLFLDGGRTGSGNSQNTSINMGFNTTLVGGDAVLGYAPNASHPIINGSAGNAGIGFLGFPFAGDIVVGPGTPIIQDLSGNTLLLERSYGTGMAWFGGLTTPDYGWGNSTDILWRNMLDYMGNSGLPPSGVPEPGTWLLLAGGLAILVIRLKKAPAELPIS